MFEKKRLLNSEITQTSQTEALNRIVQLARAGKSASVIFANVHMLIEAYYDDDFQAVLSEAEMTLPDGKPLSIAMNWLYGTSQERIAGPDFMERLFKKAEEENLSLFLYGSLPEVLTAMENRLKAEYPHLIVAGSFSPPFRALSDNEDQEICERILQSNAQIILVGLGCPKQEKWMQAHYDKLSCVMLGVGAAFPFYTGHLKRAPVWMQRISLEWLFRLLAEPRRLFRRYFVTNGLFLLLISRQWIQQIGKSIKFN